MQVPLAERNHQVRPGRGAGAARNVSFVLTRKSALQERMKLYDVICHVKS